jgi:hypothetical protein
MREPSGARAVVRVGFFRRDLLHGALDAHLPLELLPEKNQRRRRVRREVMALAALVVGEEDQAALVGALQQADARRGPAVGVDRRHGHRRRLEHLRAERLLHPRVELPERVGVHGALVERFAGVLVAQLGEGDRGGVAHGR